MARNKIVAVILLVFLFSCSERKQSDEEVIVSVMQKQQECWNNGDIDCFMQSYWHNDSLRFIGSKGINYGWETTLKNYKKSYPPFEDMGKLTFTFEEIKVFTATEAYVLGQWHLERKEKGDLGGYFSLLWKKINNKWVIVSDHTS